jgi:TonB family protein
MKQYINSKIHYPDEAREQGISGRVNLKLTIDSIGKIISIKVAKSSGNKILDEAAIKFTQSMPNWNPAVYKGKKVVSYYRFPISYSINNGGSSTKADTYYQKGVSFYEKGSQDEALIWFLKSIEINDSHLDALYNCGAIYFKQKKTDKACEYWKKIRDIGYNDAEILIYKYCN